MFATLDRVAMLQRTLFGGGEPAVDEQARIDRIELDDASWIDIVARLAPRRRHAARHADRSRSSGSRAAGACTTACSTTRASPTGTGAAIRFRTPRSMSIGAQLDALLGVRLSGPACNYYRDGNDSVAWHADASSGSSPTRASRS